VKAMTDLRARLRAGGVEYLVVKNSLTVRAIERLDVPDLAEFLVGPTGLVVGREDAIAAAKVLRDFAKEHDDRPTVKVGVVEQQRVDADHVRRLAELPPRDELLAQLVGLLQAPLAQLLMLMSAIPAELAGLLDALRAERETA